MVSRNLTYVWNVNYVNDGDDAILSCIFFLLLNQLDVFFDVIAFELPLCYNTEMLK